MHKTSYKDTIYKLVNLANHSAYQAKDSILMGIPLNDPGPY